MISAPRRLGIGRFEVVDTATGEVVHRGRPRYAGKVERWENWHFWTLDFSTLRRAGEYVVVAGPGRRSFPFEIVDLLLERRTLSHLAHYFKGQRSSGQFDKMDHRLPIGQNGPGAVDAHGAWYDATGDFGKHFTQLSHTSYFNTLSIPLTAWTLSASYGHLTAREEPNFEQLRTWLLDEALFGADYLARVKVDGGSFLSSISQPGPPKDPNLRYLNAVQTPGGPVPAQVNYREGGGVAIAALARASTYDVSGKYQSEDYLKAAEGAFAYLQENNVRLTNDGKENILDDAGALLAATELFTATENAAYKRAADERAASLAGRLVSWRGYRDYWRADDGGRPFFHPSDAGLPVVSLLTYHGVADAAMRAHVLDVVRRSLRFELRVTGEVTNPFGYARELVQDRDGRRYSGFFFPQNVTPRARDNWWQGENARADQLNWILGVNPYDVCMLDGSGRNNPEYLWLGSWQFLAAAGGIVNGITGKEEDGSGIQWDVGFVQTGKDDDWRYKEQWIPHASWYLYAVAIGG